MEPDGEVDSAVAASLASVDSSEYGRYVHGELLILQCKPLKSVSERRRNRIFQRGLSE
jgi:hypothetical protein